jgi:hypothetical protein
MESLVREQVNKPEYVSSTFKSTRVINSHSVEMLKSKQLDFRISHRFGRINSGAYNFWGLDQATIRFGLEYGLSNKVNLGVGRSSFGKTFDGYLKVKLFSQRSDNIFKMPVTVVWFSNAALSSLQTVDNYINNHLSARLSYVHQLIIGRKFNEWFSLQVSPTLVHRNYIQENSHNNDIYAAAIGSRLKLSKRISLNADYIYRFNQPKNNGFYNSFSMGIDIETGGHVFQLHVTNSQGMIEQVFIAGTTGNWKKGDIYYGFNISRQFNLGKRPKKV